VQSARRHHGGESRYRRDRDHYRAVHADGPGHGTDIGHAGFSVCRHPTSHQQQQRRSVAGKSYRSRPAVCDYSGTALMPYGDRWHICPIGPLTTSRLTVCENRSEETWLTVGISGHVPPADVLGSWMPWPCRMGDARAHWASYLSAEAANTASSSGTDATSSPVSQRLAPF
jgi:hypothetical protein